MPNVSFCEDTPNEVHYNPYEEPETRVVATFDGGRQTIGYFSMDEGVGTLNQFFSVVEIDGVESSIEELDNNDCMYEFSNGEHIVKYTLINPKVFDGRLFMFVSAKKILIPNTISTIGDDAFLECPNLTDIKIPNSVTSIGYSAISNCPSLTSVTIGNGVESIGNSAFQTCTNLTSITIEPVTPPTLGDDAFYDTNSCPIYVPSESVSTYKSTSGWSVYADRIQAIPAE